MRLGSFLRWHLGPQVRAYSKQFGRYIGAQGVTDEAKVFHSFRHTFTDALNSWRRRKIVSRALVGDAQGGVHRTLALRRIWPRVISHRLAEAIASVAYTGLDLSHLMKDREPEGPPQQGQE